MRNTKRGAGRTVSADVYQPDTVTLEEYRRLTAAPAPVTPAAASPAALDPEKVTDDSRR